MAKSRLNVNLDSDLKEQAGRLLSEMGLDYTTAVMIFFQQVVNLQKILFEIAARKNMTVDEFLGSDWREGLDDIEDEWE